MVRPGFPPPIERPRRRSMRVAVTEPRPEGQEEDLQVEAEAPALDVVKVVLDPLLDRGLPPPAVDLRPAGDARLHLVAEHVAGHAPSELLDEARALRGRAHEAHLTAQEVSELRQLRRTPSSQARPDPPSPRVIRPRP